VSEFLESHRTLCCRVAVQGPSYQKVRIQAKVHVSSGHGKDVQKRATDAITNFLHPLQGGPVKKGWPFGRAVHPGEILQSLASLPGVRFVTDLGLAADDDPFGDQAVPVAPQSLVHALPEILVEEDA
jgi:hypothetical protein